MPRNRRGGHWRRRIRRGPQAPESHKASCRAHFRYLPSVWARGDLCCLHIPAPLLVPGGAQDRGKTKGRDQPHPIYCELQLQAQAGGAVGRESLIVNAFWKVVDPDVLSTEIKQFFWLGGGQRILHNLWGLRSALRLYSLQELKRAGSGRHVGCFKTPVFYLEFWSSPGCEPTK